MKIINTLTVLLLSFALHQTTATIDPSKLTDGQEIYSFDDGGMYNALISSNETFQPIGNVSIDAASGNTTTINNKKYLLTADTSATKLGYVESTYASITDLSELQSIMGDDEYSLLSSTEGFASVCTGGGLFGVNIGSMLQTYTTVEGGYIALLGTNKAGQQNGDTGINSGKSYYTLYSPVYGTAVAA
jgi:hypothetical protein